MISRLASLSSPSERNRARSAFKRFFPPKSLCRVYLMITLGQSLRVFDALSLIYSTSCFHRVGDASPKNPCLDNNSSNSIE
jgi:hypothetical protein